MLRKKIDGLILLILRNISLQTMDRQQGQRQRKAAGGGGVGNVGSLTSVAFWCHLCNISFEYKDDLQVHEMTDHAEQDELDQDYEQTGAPRSFMENSVFGPTHSDFTPHHAAKIQEMLDQRIGGPDTVKMPVIPHPLVPRSQDLFGWFRGIQGRMNSCYLDVFFFFMAFSTAFDGIFTEKALNDSIFLRIVLFEIVIPLRTRMYVNREVVAMLRTFLADATMNVEYLTNTWDFTEFLMNLLQQVDFRNVCNFLGETITCGLLIQIKGVYGDVLSLQQLIDHTLEVDNIRSLDPPKAFILRVRPNLVSEPPLCLPQSTVSLNGCSYRLSAIICVSRSHFIGFYQLENGMWIFFDCMRDKQNGHSIPFITPVPGFSDYIANGCDEQFLSEKNDGGSRDLYDVRVREGSYAYIYSMNDDRSQPFVQTVPVLPPSIQAPIVDETKVLPPPQSNSAGSAAAVSAKPAQSSRIPSEGGVAAPVPHRSPPSFGHFQQDRRRFDAPFVIEAKYLPDSVFSTLDGFLRAMAEIVGKLGACPQYVEVTGLSIPSASADSLQLFGSFPVLNGDENYCPYRPTDFMFDDGSVKQYDGSVDDLSDPENKATFSERVLQFWRDRNRVLSGIRFERCALKQIPSK